MNTYNFLAGSNFTPDLSLSKESVMSRKTIFRSFTVIGIRQDNGEVILNGSQASLLPSSAILSLYSPVNVRRSESLLTEKFFLNTSRPKGSMEKRLHV